ncbi:MAG: aminoacyl-tRNA hydrolase [Mycobacterium leprae]
MVKLVAGLGNPGPKYERTRHNTGWMVLDAFAKKQGVDVSQSGFHGVYGEWRRSSTDRVVLLKPLTFMNLSGRSVAAAAHYYKVDPADILVVYDDLDLQPGKLRLREKGSAGGHNGMKSMIQELGTQDFPRLRVGIGRPAPGWEVVDWVLAPFGVDEGIAVADCLPRAVEAIESFLADGALKAMAKFNGL